MNTTVSFLLVVVAVALGCQDSGHEEAAHHEHATAPAVEFRAAGTPDNLLVIDREMLRDLRITTAPVEARTAGENVTMLGELRVNEDAYAEVGAPITARVLRVLASPGEIIRPGHTLAELQSIELGKARAEYLAAKARRDLAQHSLQRKRSLAAGRIVPQRELQEAEAEAGPRPKPSCERRRPRSRRWVRPPTISMPVGMRIRRGFHSARRLAGPLSSAV